MIEEKFQLTPTDANAIKQNDSNYINQKGANLYRKGSYAQAVEYYRVAAAMGDINAISNLGYCYLYGRDVEANLSLALAYFEISAARKQVDSCFKLGDIYGSDKWGLKDKELSIYYYRMAASYLIDDDWEYPNAILYADSLIDYPSLCFALAREMMPDGDMATNLDQAYQFLKQAKIGYEKELANGSSYYEKSYQNVLEYLSNEIFDDIRKKYNDITDELDD